MKQENRRQKSNNERMMVLRGITNGSPVFRMQD